MNEISENQDNEQFHAESEKLKTRVLQVLENNKDLAGEKNKQALREIHRRAAQSRLQKDRHWCETKFPKYERFFANGSDISIKDIKPLLVEVTETWHSELFRLARYTWSMPYSSGYGRRMRFLVFDQSNYKLMGLIGFQSPPLNFNVRDKELDFVVEKKVEFVNQMMDIFTLGALPPYNILLGGKLVALIAACNEVVEVYRNKYENRVTNINGNVLPAHLIALTTTSAFGRSSIYNRLKYHDRLVAYSLGFTSGYGSFHLQDVYPAVKEFLRKYGKLSGSYGDGSKPVWANLRRAFRLIGIEQDGLYHGVQREVFLFPLIENLKEYISGKESEPKYYNMPFQEVVEFWKARWLFERAKRKTEWQTWNKTNISDWLFSNICME